MTKLICLIISCIALCGYGTTFAATYYCSPSGGSTGADFSHLMTMPNTTGFGRGNTYVIVDGSYGSKTLSTATSGTNTITIRKANAAQDSSVAGYSTTLHDGQATFSELNIHTQYWIVDGITRTEMAGWSAPNGYGFRVTSIVCHYGDATDNGSNSQFRYIDIGDTYSTSQSGSAWVIYYVGQTNVTFSHCAIHNAVNETLFQGAGSNSITFEYCAIGPGWGKEALRGGNGGTSSSWVIRYNKFWNSVGGPEGLTAEIALWDWSGTATGSLIYGNWFYNTTSHNRNASIVIGGNGSSWAGGGATGSLCYNNTFAAFPESSAFGTIILNGSSTVARNNLAYGITGSLTVTASTSSNNVKVTSDPFVNYSSYDLHLSNESSDLAGYVLSSPYNTDMDGQTRGQGTYFDIGAYEKVASGYHYIKQGGSGDGSSWTSALDNLPGSLVRGDTYFMADGTYSSKTYNDSGTSTIKITRCVNGVTDALGQSAFSTCSSDSGYVDTDHDGQAVFGDTNIFNYGNYTFDGVVGGGPGSWETGHGIKFLTTTNKIIVPHAVLTDSLKFSRCEFAGTIVSESGSGDFFYADSGVVGGNGGFSNLTIEYCYLHNAERTFLLTYTNPSNGVLIQYSKFKRNGTAAHREAWSFGADDNVTIRYNMFEDIFSTGFLCGVNGTGTALNWDIYGNVFYHTGNYPSGSVNSGVIMVDDNCPSYGADINASNWKIFNNSFVDINFANTNSFGALEFTWCDGGVDNTGIVAYNNMFYSYNSLAIQNADTEGYNWYRDIGQTLTGTGDQQGSGNPFVNIASQNFALSGSYLPSAGYNTSTLLSGNNTDMLGVTRGSDGTWDRGAFEYGAGGDTTAPAVTGCTIKSTSGNKIRTGGGGVQLRLQ